MVGRARIDILFRVQGRLPPERGALYLFSPESPRADQREQQQGGFVVMTRSKLEKLVLTAMFCAIITAMTFIPFVGYITYGG